MPSPMKKVRKCIDENVLAFSKLTEHGFTPIRGTDYSAGYDLKSAYSYVVKAHGKELIKTDIQIKVPQGTYGRIAPRSGLAWKNFIDVGAGVIDSDYRGNVGVLLYNHSDDDFIVNKGDRVAQLICEKIVCPEVVELETLDDTVRGEGGFGSTGTN
ncbi:PREDICTED: deoxyuridine 5'-triphosphate nucleotidohydrolase [Diuraphis noxia]|uniref:deoxyuridine 5'-triphosphate nucleotidohydrolase n=1 Tax=Diuraphis noxia TaxID=143948 RepID=UPI0007637FA5|nr:PREDICTED: deoxyuridine 5'-triphosphate nucleotidohydrolase [Diuraphis noxia]